MAKVNLPYGIDLFEQVRSRNCYYVDKTDFIRELLNEEFTVNLITRPRRFGKTLTMSMLAEFFDIRKDSRQMFEGLEIAKYTDFCAEWMNQWPILFLTLKDVDGDSFEDAYGLLQYTISVLCIEHSYLTDSDKVDSADKERFLRLKSENGTVSDVGKARRLGLLPREATVPRSLATRRSATPSRSWGPTGWSRASLWTFCWSAAPSWPTA